MAHRLVACLHADVSGHRRLISGDVEETARSSTTYQEVIGAIVVTYGASAIDVAGDGVLAAFPTVPGAVRCAVEIQRWVRVHNAGLPTRRRIECRVGIEFGDVLVDGDRLSGDCVDVATRVRQVAAPGRICLAGSAFDRISPLSLPCEYLGERKVGNIDGPVRIYQVGAGCGG